MKKLKGLIIMFLISLSLFGLTACQDSGNNATYEQITAKEAKEVMGQIKEFFSRTEMQLFMLAPSLVTHGGPGCIVIQAIRK